MVEEREGGRRGGGGDLQCQEINLSSCQAINHTHDNGNARAHTHRKHRAGVWLSGKKNERKERKRDRRKERTPDLAPCCLFHAPHRFSEYSTATLIINRLYADKTTRGVWWCSW